MARKQKNTKEMALAKEIKKMEMAKKDEAAKTAPQPKAKPEADVIDFDMWWMGMIRKVDMRPSYKEIVIADFKARGFSMREKQEDYDRALELFGIKLPL